MGQFSVKIYRPTGSVLSANQHSVAQAADVDTAEITILAYSVSMGGFDALPFSHHHVIELSDPIPVTVGDEDLIISPETVAQTNITLDGDDQGPITDLRYEEITWQNDDGEAETAIVAVIERAVTADYLLVPINTEARTLSSQELPTGVEITRPGLAQQFDGEVSLITDIEQNGGILARNDHYRTEPSETEVLDVLSNDDVLGDAPLQLTEITQPSNGTASIVNGAIEFTANPGFIGVTYIDYTITNGEGLTDTGQARIDVLPEDYTVLEDLPGQFVVGLQNTPEFFISLPDPTLIFGTGAQFNTDFISEFKLGDRLQLNEPGLTVTNMVVTTSSTVFEITDTKLDDTVYQFTLLGDFSGETFRFSNRPTNLDIRLSENNSVILTQSGDRFITTTDEGSIVYGDQGDDVIVTSISGDILSGGAGDDIMSGGAGRDFLLPGTGQDIMTGGEGPDTFFFDIVDFAGDSVIAKYIKDYEPGIDTIEISGYGFAEFSELSFLSLPVGDAIQLASNQFIVIEGFTQDQLNPDDFNFAIAGRAFTLAASPIVHELTDANDRFITTDDGPNDVRAGAGIDAILGGNGSNILYGEADDDVLIGGTGADRLIGGQGADRMTGNGGADSFEFTAGEETGFVAEFIVDFEAEDKVLLNGFGYTSTEDLSFQNVATGDLALQLTSSHFIVFEGIGAEDELTGNFEFL